MNFILDWVQKNIFFGKRFNKLGGEHMRKFFLLLSLSVIASFVVTEFASAGMINYERLKKRKGGAAAAKPAAVAARATPAVPAQPAKPAVPAAAAAATPATPAQAAQPAQPAKKSAYQW